jgi:agmatine deiminase
MAQSGTTPAAGGFALPADWSPHTRCWMAWPCRESLWAGRIAEARAAFAELAKAIADYEPVTMMAREAHVVDASIMCGAGVEVMPLALDDSWARDTGPAFLTGQAGTAGVDWGFNGWGGKYAPHADDDAIAEKVLARLGFPRYAAPVVLEGGAYTCDGEGTLIVTEQCALNRNRNPGLTLEVMTQTLKDYLGVRKVIWLAGGLDRDETEGHVDNVARFAAPGVVLAVSPGEPGDDSFEVLTENLARLSAARDAQGRRLEVRELPRPAPRLIDGRELVQSYANFYVANGAVIAPIFEDPNDGKAHEVIAHAFPKRRIEQVRAADICFGGGGIHCATLEQPAAGAGD